MIKPNEYQLEISRLCDIVFTMPHIRNAEQDCFDIIDGHIWLSNNVGIGFIIAQCGNDNAFFDKQHYMPAFNAGKTLLEIARYAMWQDLHNEHTQRWNAGMRRNVNNR